MKKDFETNFTGWTLITAAILFGFVAMCVILFIPDHFEIYKPVFYAKVIWLALTGVMMLRKDINLPIPQVNN